MKRKGPHDFDNPVYEYAHPDGWYGYSIYKRRFGFYTVWAWGRLGDWYAVKFAGATRPGYWNAKDKGDFLVLDLINE
jgi:hypothetical protein